MSDMNLLIRKIWFQVTKRVPNSEFLENE